MKITELKIAPQNAYRALSEENPMICTVRLASEKATVETVLSEDQVLQVLHLVQGIVADAAKRNVAEFVAQAFAISADPVAKIGGDA